MSSTCSSRFRIRCASRAVALSLAALSLCGPAAAQRDQGVVVELLPVEALLTVAAFLSLVDRRYFDGSTWHRVVPNFVVQDGDPRGDGWGGPGFALRDEVNPVRCEPRRARCDRAGRANRKHPSVNTSGFNY